MRILALSLIGLSASRNLLDSQSQLTYTYNADNRLERTITPVGYIDGASGSHYAYIRDHQGNNRATLSADGWHTEVMKYYPFGTATWHGDQADRYRFGGKELDRTLGLDLYDFEARMYDPVLARFCQPDRMAGKYPWLSPYAYCANNPIRYIDPSGQIIMAYGDTGETYNLEIKDNRLVFMTSDNIAFSGDDPLLEETLLGVNNIAANPFGNAFIKKLIADDNIAYIRPIYNGENIARERPDGSYLIHWNPFNGEGGLSEYGTDRPPFIGLSHELGHFDDYISQLNGIIPWFDTSSNKIVDQSEIYACYIENRIRLENNIPVRTFYTTKDNGGYEPSRVAYPPNLLLLPPKWPQMIKFCDYYPINISK